MGSRSKESSHRNTGTTMHSGTAASSTMSGSATSPNCRPRVSAMTSAPMPKSTTSTLPSAMVAGQSRAGGWVYGVSGMGTG